MTLASDGLHLWLGTEFAENSTRVLQWLTIGVFISSLAQISFALVQGVGRPDLTAKLHLIMLPVYLLTVWWLISVYGIEGAAIAWLTRIVVDTLILFGMVWRLLPKSASMIRCMAFTTAVALLTLAFATLLVDLAIKGLFLLLVLSVFVPTAWFLILAPEDRALVQNRLKILHAFD